MPGEKKRWIHFSQINLKILYPYLLCRARDKGIPMKQDSIWDFYQNEMPEFFSASDVRLTFVAVPFDYRGLALDGWWSRKRESIYVFKEYVRLSFYWAKGYL